MSRGPLNQHNGEIIVCLANAAGIDLLIAEDSLDAQEGYTYLAQGRLEEEEP